MLFKFSEGFMQTAEADELMAYVEEGYLHRFVSYILHSDYRKATNLVPWVRAQVEEGEIDEEVKRVLKQIPSYQKADKQMLAVFNWVRKNIKYESDRENWEMSEYWQTASETLSRRTGDCEDGAILMYVLARLKGIDANRMRLMAGDVVGGGHCWLAYRPEQYFLNWAFMDWCYWPNDKTMNYRTLFYVDGQEITGYSHTNEKITGIYDNYTKLWFLFNENKSNRTVKYIYNDKR